MDRIAAARQARALLRGARSGVLATQRDGQPSAGLVTPAMAPDLSPLLFLSTLAEHTRHLQHEPRCALLVQAGPVAANPQTAPRASVTGRAERVPEAELAVLKARWLALHPYAAPYADFADFALWRIRPEAVRLVGGFAAAARLKAADLVPPAVAVAAVAAAEAAICSEVNQGDAPMVQAMARAAGAAAGPVPWRLVAVDVDGADLMAGEARCRVDFAVPVAEAAGLREALAAVAGRGLEPGGSAAG